MPLKARRARGEGRWRRSKAHEGLYDEGSRESAQVCLREVLEDTCKRQKSHGCQWATGGRGRMVFGMQGKATASVEGCLAGIHGADCIDGDILPLAPFSLGSCQRPDEVCVLSDLMKRAVAAACGMVLSVRRRARQTSTQRVSASLCDDELDHLLRQEMYCSAFNTCGNEAHTD